MNEDAQKLIAHEKKRRKIAIIYAPLFFIFCSFIAFIYFDFFAWRTHITAFSKEIFLQKTTDFFALKDLEISGNIHVSDEKIQEILCNEINHQELFNSHVLLFPLPTIQAKLSYLDWIESVNVKRHLPDKISINIMEKKPLAKWKITSSNNVYLVDENGLIFKKFEGENIGNVPIIKNSFGKIDFLIDIFKKNSKMGLEIFEIELRVFWHIKLVNDLVLKISPEQMDDFMNTIQKLSDRYQIFSPNTDIAFIDFCNESKVYVKKKK